ncbi:MAG: hypothetical protein GTO40_21660, partial [Deltaproteobacteria bacterium]|nr:hypothetical protein [Deltaproteobacteria bacterium]
MKRSIEELVSEISNGNVPSLMVLHGDDLQVHEATQRILDLLVPPDQRSVGLERFDGRITAWDQIESALRTPSLFTDSKTVWIEHAPYFISRERKGDLVERVLQLWADEKKDEAARLFLDYLALEGWSQEQLEKAIPSVESPAGALLGGVKGNEKELGEVLGFARDRGMDLDQHKTGQGTDLAGFLEGGIPPWGRLLISTSHVDKRLRIYKRLEQEGVVLELGIERERSGRIKRETLTELVDRRVREAG